MSWTTDPATGNIILAPVLGWATALMAGTGCGLRMEVVRSPEQLAAGQPEPVQMVMTPAQALALAEDRRTMAALAMRPAPPGQKPN